MRTIFFVHTVILKNSEMSSQKPKKYIPAGFKRIRYIAYELNVTQFTRSRTIQSKQNHISRSVEFRTCALANASCWRSRCSSCRGRSMWACSLLRTHGPRLWPRKCHAAGSPNRLGLVSYGNDITFELQIEECRLIAWSL